MRKSKKTLSMVLAVVLAFTLFQGVAVAAGEVSPAAATFAISSVAVQDSRTAVVTLNAVMCQDLYDFMSQNIRYWTQFIKIDGVVLNDKFPHQGSNAGQNLWPNDNGSKIIARDDGKSFELVLPSGRSFETNHTYAISVDFSEWTSKTTGGAQSAATYWKDIDGNTMPASNTFTFSPTAPLQAPVPLNIESVYALSKGAVQVTFNQRVVTGMPARAASGNITFARGGVTASATYAEPVLGSDGKAFNIYFMDPFATGDTVTLAFAAGLNLTDRFNVRSPALSINYIDSEKPFDYVIQNAKYGKTGDTQEIIVILDNPIGKVSLAAGGEQTLFETGNGRVGATLTREDIANLFTFTGITGPNGADFIASLGDIAGRFADSRTVVIHNDKRTVFTVATGATVALKPNRLFSPNGAALGTPNANTTAAALTAFGEVAPVTGYNPAAPEALTVNKNATITFRYIDYDYDQYDGARDPLAAGIDPRLQIVGFSSYINRDRMCDRTFQMIEVENKYIKATFVPEFGGRMLNLFYKPTGHDQFLLNRVGVPYGQGFKNAALDPTERLGIDSFYSNWLMVWGGIFPTFPQPEHGKYWYLPWDYDKTDDFIDENGNFRLKLSITDDLVYDNINFPRFALGATGLTCEATYIIPKNKPYAQLDINIKNPTDQMKYYEYWTCTTLAPGIDTYDGSPTGMIVAPTQVLFRDGYSWMANVESEAYPKPAAGQPDTAPQYVKDFEEFGFNPWDTTQAQKDARRTQYINYDKLNYFKNWASSGIAYCQDLARLPQADWWGVINQENQEGFLRIADNSVTPGMKYWLWAYNGSYTTQPYNTTGSSRPYIELWAGPSNKFFDMAYLKAGESIHWTETYTATNGLYDVTNANENGAINIKFTPNGNRFNVAADVSSTGIGQWQQMELRLENGTLLGYKDFTVNAINSETVKGTATVGATDKIVATLMDAEGNVLVSAWDVQGSKPAPQKIDTRSVTLNFESLDVDVNPIASRRAPANAVYSDPNATDPQVTAEWARNVKEIFAYVEPFAADSKHVDFTSSDPSVCEPFIYYNSGYQHVLLDAKKPGVVTITATVKDGAQTYTDTGTVKVYGPATGVTIGGPVVMSLKRGRTLDLGKLVTIAPAGLVRDTGLTYRVGNTAILSIDANGVITGLKAGMSPVYVTSRDGGFTDQVVISVVS